MNNIIVIKYAVAMERMEERLKMSEILDKNSREKKMLYEWGTRNCEAYHFQEKNENEESYFTPKLEERSSYIMEYGFETLPEVAKALDDLWGSSELMAEIKKVVEVAALKNKPAKQSKLKDDNLEIRKEIPKSKTSEDKLPAFIYNF